MVHYTPPGRFAAQRPSPLCPKCGSHRTEIIGMSKDRRRNSSAAPRAARTRDAGGRNARARAGKVSFCSDIRAPAFVQRRHRRRRRRRPGHRDFRPPLQSARCSVVLLDGARAPGAKILVSGGSRCNVTNSDRHRARFLGRQAARPSGACCARSRQRDDRVLPRDRRVAPRGGRRQAVSRYQPRARRARCAAARMRRRRRAARAAAIACSTSNRPAAAFAS